MPRFLRHSRVGSSSGSGVSCGGRSASGTCRRFTRIRVQVEDLPRMESVSTSSTVRNLAASGFLLFHLSRPASAASLSGEFATHEWHPRPRLLGGGPGTRRGHARGFACHLAKVGGPGRVPEAGGLVLCCELEQFFEGTGRGVHPGVRIADFREAFRNCKYGEVDRLAIRHLMPVKRRGHTGIGKWAYGIGRASRAVFRVLVVVEEHAMTLLFPPFRACYGRCAPLDCT